MSQTIGRFPDCATLARSVAA